VVRAIENITSFTIRTMTAQIGDGYPILSTPTGMALFHVT